MNTHKISKSSIIKPQYISGIIGQVEKKEEKEDGNEGGGAVRLVGSE